MLNWCLYSCIFVRLISQDLECHPGIITSMMETAKRWCHYSCKTENTSHSNTIRVFFVCLFLFCLVLKTQSALTYCMYKRIRTIRCFNKTVTQTKTLCTSGSRGLSPFHGLYRQDNTRGQELDSGWRPSVGGNDASAWAGDRHRQREYLSQQEMGL